MIRIDLEIFLEILYFLNWLLRHSSLSGQEDFARLSRLIWKMARKGVFKGIPDKNFPMIREVVKNFKRMENLEK